MEEFIYFAKDREGQTVRASLMAASRNEALALLNEQALTVIEIARGSFSSNITKGEGVPRSARPPQKTLGGWRMRFARVRLSDMALFCRQLAITINAGVPLRDALETIATDTTHPVLYQTLRNLIALLHDGKSFSQAMAAQKGVFSNLLVSLIAAAEEAGSMAQTLNQVANYLERNDRLARKIISITAYPIFVSAFFGLICLIMTLFVLPQFQGIFVGFHAKLPLLTRLVFGGNQFILHHIWALTLSMLGLVVLFLWFRNTPTGRMKIDTWKLRAPLVGNCLVKYILARVCRNLAVMLRGGVPVTMALESVSRISDNKTMEKALLAARERVVGGADIAASLAVEPCFPRILISMVNVGEQSGRLPDVLERLSDVYEDQVEGAVLVATALFEPIMICIFGAIVLVLVLAIYMPIFSMGAASGR